MPEVKFSEVRRFMVECLKAFGTPEEYAQAQADLLIHADTVGNYSHGLVKLQFYLNDIKCGTCVPMANPVILKESAATAWVDGCLGLGAPVANFCMDLAIKKAKECGVSWVTAKRCNHYGMAGYWALKAEREGLIGISSTNGSALMVPTRAKQKALGTNPIAMAAPAAGGDKLVVDMATTAAAMGKIQMKMNNREPLPVGWALGANGKPTTDAKEAYSTAKLMPLGGEEISSGYKGYCLASMIEILCSGLSGSNQSFEIRPWELSDTKIPLNFGQCFAVIDPSCFAPGFAERIGKFLNMLRNLEPMDPALPVVAPGDRHNMNIQKTTSKGTITYSANILDTMEKMAKTINVKPMQINTL